MDTQIKIYRPEKINYKLCPSCKSYFLTDDECQSCGFQLKFDRIGKPFGERSFYYYKHNYIKSWPLPVKLFNFLENMTSEKAVSYSRQLQFRFDDFMKYVDLWYVRSADTVKYLVEIGDLIKEMVFYGIPIKDISAQLEKRELEYLFHEVLASLESQQQEKKWQLKKILNGRVFYFLRLRFLLFLLIFLFSIFFLLSFSSI